VPPPVTPPVTPPTEPPVAQPPRDVTQPPAPTAPPSPSAAAQILVTPPGEFRVAGGPYTGPHPNNNVSRPSTVTGTITYNPNVLRVRNVQEGMFMRQGSATATFTPRIDAAAGRVDVVVTRGGDQVGASGSGLIAALLFDAVGPGNSLIQISGVASNP